MVHSLCVMCDLGDSTRSVLANDSCKRKYIYGADSIDYVPSLVSLFLVTFMSLTLTLLKMETDHPLRKGLALRLL